MKARDAEGVTEAPPSASAWMPHEKSLKLGDARRESGEVCSSLRSARGLARDDVLRRLRRSDGGVVIASRARLQGLRPASRALASGD